jgi:uncharacterized lipoprotein YddW (UPF0748 family)
MDRGVFLVPWLGIDPETVVAQLADVGATFLSLSVKDSMGRTWARSDVVPRWRGSDRDVVADICAAAHRRQIKVRASVAVFADTYQGQIHPDRVAVGGDAVLAQRPGWSEDWSYHLCPARPEQRAYTLAFVSELVERYDLDGIDLDFIRFPWKPANEDGPERYFCFCAECHTRFAKETGESWPADAMSSATWYRWRDSVITSFVSEIADVCTERGATLAPFIAFWGSEGLGPQELTVAARRFGQDHAALAKICTELSPMLYHHYTDEPTFYINRTVRWVKDLTWWLRELDARVCAVVQGGPPARPMEIYDEVRGAMDGGANAVMSYPGWSWSVENEYWKALGGAYGQLPEELVGTGS